MYFLLDLRWEFSICIVESTCTWDNNDREISQVLYYHYAIVFRFIFKRFKLTLFLQETHLSEYRTGAPVHSASLPSWSWRPDTIRAPAWIHVPPEVAGRNLIDRFTVQPMANVYCLWAWNRLNVSISDILFQSCGISLHFFLIPRANLAPHVCAHEISTIDMICIDLAPFNRCCAKFMLGNVKTYFHFLSSINCNIRLQGRQGSVWPTSGLILDLRPANERRRYKVTPSLIDLAQT